MHTPPSFVPRATLVRKEGAAGRGRGEEEEKGGRQGRRRSAGH